MENPRSEKVALVNEVRERLTASSATLLTEYRGMKVGDLAALRRSLRQAGGDYKIYKNTLVRLAAQEVGMEHFVGLLEGPTGLAFVGGDAANVAKVLRDFARAHPSLVLKGGVLGDSPLTAAQMASLADLPSRDVLLGRLAGGLAAPLQQLAGLLEALPRNLAWGLKALLEDRCGTERPDATAPESPPTNQPTRDKD